MRNLLGRLLRIVRAPGLGAVDEPIDHGAGTMEIGQ
jgi:hypothetical protein